MQELACRLGRLPSGRGEMQAQGLTQGETSMHSLMNKF